MSKEIIIPSSPTDQKKLYDGVQEIVNSMIRASSETEYQREALAELSEAFGIDKKHIRRMAVDTFKDAFDKKAKEFDDYSTLYETIMVIKNHSKDTGEDDES